MVHAFILFLQGLASDLRMFTLASLITHTPLAGGRL